MLVDLVCLCWPQSESTVEVFKGLFFPSQPICLHPVTSHLDLLLSNLVLRWLELKKKSLRKINEAKIALLFPFLVPWKDGNRQRNHINTGMGNRLFVLHVSHLDRPICLVKKATTRWLTLWQGPQDLGVLEIQFNPRTLAMRSQVTF